ncbi:MAG TPA: hypothetical protein VGH73_21900 [Thermoanaerobaculia bacterium]|jgi:hypothetical protein
MKKRSGSTKLTLNRETLRVLEQHRLKTIAGLAHSDFCTFQTCATTRGIDCYSTAICA